jgi:uncharacterized protein YjcR
MYEEVSGNISLEQLARRIGVADSTLRRWKRADGWLKETVGVYDKLKVVKIVL